jgi:CTP:molybdopterin cytidylyltransferase MocA
MQTEYPVIVLAGGNGKRAGMPKGLIEFNGKPWLEAQIRELEERGLNRLVIVLGYRAEDHFSAMPWLREGKRAAVRVNSHPEHGQFSSFLAGARSLVEAEGIYLLPVDVPVPDAEVWETLAKNLKGHDACIPEWRERGGHPVLLSRSFVKQLLKLREKGLESRLDTQLHKLPKEKIARLPVNDMRVGMNFNSAEEFNKWAATA